MLLKKKLLLNTLWFSILLEIIALLMYFTLNKSLVSPALPFLVPFFFSVSLLSNLWLVSIPPDNPNQFVRTFMLTVFLKFMLYVIVLVVYVMLYRFDAMRFLFTFLILYIIYLVFDVIILLQHLPKKQ